MPRPPNRSPDDVSLLIFGRPFVKRFALCYRIFVCSVLSVLSVTLVYCGKTATWIKMALGKEVGLSPGDKCCVRCGPNSPTERGTAAPPLFGPCLLWPNGCPSQLLLSSCLSGLPTFQMIPPPVGRLNQSTVIKYLSRSKVT